MIQKKLAVVGCGLRSDAYLNQLRPDLGKSIEIVAFADPDKEATDAYVACYGNGKPIQIYQNGPELINNYKGKLDAIIIGSPNFCHEESLLPSLKSNLVTLLEKPIAHTFDACKKMWQTYEKYPNSAIAVGFVLRYTNFYQKIKSLLDQNVVGKILTVDATESLGAPLTAVFVRGAGKWAWRSSNELSGSFLLEKCCHDMDMLNFLICARPQKVSSFATRSYFVPDKNLPLRCRNCKIADECRYNDAKLKKYQIADSRKDEMSTLLPSKDEDSCVFNSTKDIPDHQNVIIEYQNGVLATFTATMNQPKTTRTIAIRGTDGQILGDIRENTIEIRRHSKNGEQVYHKEVINITHDDSGHDGGDSLLSRNLKKMILEKSPNSLAGMREGIEACLLVFAAEKARIENQVVNLDTMYNSMFGAKTFEV